MTLAATDQRIEIPTPIHHYPRKGLFFERATDRRVLPDALERFARGGFPAPCLDPLLDPAKRLSRPLRKLTADYLDPNAPSPDAMVKHRAPIPDHSIHAGIPNHAHPAYRPFIALAQRS